MKRLLPLLGFLLSAACMKTVVTPPPANSVARDFVHISGTSLLDTAGQPLSLRGVNLGGWLLWESWIWGGGFQSEKDMLQLLASRTDDAYTAAFMDSIYRHYIGEADIRAIHELGFNVVRIPFNHRLLDDDVAGGPLLNKGLNVLDSVVAWCGRYGVYAVLDMHAVPGGQSSAFTSDPDATTIWSSDPDKAQAVKIWTALAQRYRDTKWVLGYDLINEPIPPTNQALADLYVDMIKGIRTVDTHHAVIIEGANYAQDFSFFSNLLDSNQVFSFHFYTWFMSQSTQLSTLKTYHDVAVQLNCPMWCGEWGEASPPDLQGIKDKLADPAYGFCGDAFWTWKKVKANANSYPLQRITVSDAWLDLINGRTKSVSDSYQTIANGFLQSAQFVNNTVDPQVLSVLQSH